MRRTAEDAQLTRLALLEAALMSFAEKGWRGATFENVAERAGVTRGALHHHFRTKEALLEEALSWGWAEYGNRLFVPEGELTLGLLLTSLVDLLRTDPLFQAVAAASVLVAPQALGDVSEKNIALDSWRDQIAALVPPANHLDSGTVARLVLALIQGFTVTAVNRPSDLPQDTELDAVVAALVRGLLT